MNHDEKTRVGPLQRFLHAEVAGGVALLIAAALAILWSNSPLGSGYDDLWATSPTVHLGVATLHEDLRHLVNDGAMTLFFFVVALEIKRELLRGELASPRRAALPVAAALGGMVLPAAIYVAINAGGDGASGWGIPMATDIAFAVGVLALAGSRVPPALKVFLLAFAIVDDLGAIVVIALFYTDAVSLGALGWAAVLIGVIVVMPRLGLRGPGFYVVPGLLLWLAVLESGIHATLAGVVLAALTPAGPLAPGDAEAPLDRLERWVHPWSTLLVVPLFALANSGLDLSLDLARDFTGSAVGLGIVAGLVLGKPAGIVLFAWMAVRLRLAALPEGVGWAELGAVAILGGIGFTVALFITELAFDVPVLVEEAKVGIFVASLLAGLAGFGAVLWTMPRPRDGTTR